MDQPPPNAPEAEAAKLKIYFLPNLLTAANLFCGFVALTLIVGVREIEAGNLDQIREAIWFHSGWRAFLICSTGGWRGWAGGKVRSDASSIRWRT